MYQWLFTKYISPAVRKRCFPKIYQFLNVKNVARSEYSQQEFLQVYPFPFVFIFLLTACNKIKIHRGNEIKERYKIFENKAELESFWNDENIIKRSKFPREKDPTTQWQYQCVLFKLDISENSYFLVNRWKNCNLKCCNLIKSRTAILLNTPYSNTKPLAI